LSRFSNRDYGSWDKSTSTGQFYSLLAPDPTALFMRIAFVALSAPGHLNPTTALARQLQSRNHEVVIISLPDAEPYVRAAGLAFLPYCETAFFSAGSSHAEIRRQLSVIQGMDGVKLVIESLGGPMMEAALSSLPAALATARADAVVLDTNQYYVELIPLSLGLPYVHVSNALHCDFSGYTPLCFYDCPHETTPAAHQLPEPEKRQLRGEKIKRTWPKSLSPNSIRTVRKDHKGHEDGESNGS
jgi:hypothetical protein